MSAVNAVGQKKMLEFQKLRGELRFYTKKLKEKGVSITGSPEFVTLIGNQNNGIINFQDDALTGFLVGYFYVTHLGGSSPVDIRIESSFVDFNPRIIRSVIPSTAVHNFVFCENIICASVGAACEFNFVGWKIPCDYVI